MVHKLIGRPPKFSPALAASICTMIQDGMSIREIIAVEKMPAMSTIFKWLADNKEFSEQYARAREIQAELLADEIVQIADDGQNDTYQTDDGTKVNFDNIQRSRLRVDARKWVAAKLLPKKYGDNDRIKVETSDPNGKVMRVIVEHIR